MKVPVRPIRQRRAKKDSPSLELIVRRGALRRFDELKRKTVDLPVDVIWDPRQNERRRAEDATADERRRTDRRQKPPFTWELSDFVVVERSAEAPAPQRKRRSKLR